MRLSGTNSFPFFSHTPRTFSSETSHLNTAWSLAPTARSAMLWYTSSFFSVGWTEPVSSGGMWAYRQRYAGVWVRYMQLRILILWLYKETQVQGVTVTRST